MSHNHQQTAEAIYPDHPAPSSDAYGELYASIPSYERTAYILGRIHEAQDQGASRE